MKYFFPTSASVSRTKKITQTTLTSLLKNRECAEAEPVRPGKFSHVDHELEKTDIMNLYLFDSFSHRSSFNLALAVGLEQTEPLYDALQKRGIRTTRELYNAFKTTKLGPMSPTPERTIHDFVNMNLSLAVLCAGYHEIIFNPINVSESFLNHDVGLFLRGDGFSKLRQLFDSITKAGIIGSKGFGLGDWPVYLKTDAMDQDGTYDDTCGNYGNLCIRFRINVTQLLSLRDIYADPEALMACEMDISTEYRNTFMVFGGIPISTIHSFVIWNPKKEQFPAAQDSK